MTILHHILDVLSRRDYKLYRIYDVSVLSSFWREKWGQMEGQMIIWVAPVERKHKIQYL